MTKPTRKMLQAAEEVFRKNGVEFSPCLAGEVWRSMWAAESAEDRNVWQQIVPTDPAPDNVFILPVITSLDVPAERILDSARHLKSVVIAGYDEEGNEWFASSLADGGDVLWLIERVKQELLGDRHD